MSNESDWIEVPLYLTVGTREPILIGTSTGPVGRTWSPLDTAELLEALARGFRRDISEVSDA